VDSIISYSPEYVSWTANKVGSTTSLDGWIIKNFFKHAVLASVFLIDSFNSSTDWFYFAGRIILLVLFKFYCFFLRFVSRQGFSDAR
jgi:hypothetical protein